LTPCTASYIIFYIYRPSGIWPLTGFISLTQSSALSPALCPLANERIAHETAVCLTDISYVFILHRLSVVQLAGFIRISRKGTCRNMDLSIFSMGHFYLVTIFDRHLPQRFNRPRE